MRNSAQQPKLLVVLPDEPSARELVAFLEQHAYDVFWAREGASGYDILDADPVDAVVCALAEPRIDGLKLLQVARQRNSNVCVIVVADSEDIELGVEAMRQGAYDFQPRPINLVKLSSVLDRGLSYQRLVGEVSDLQRRLDDRYRFGGIVRRSRQWQRIYNQVEQVANSRAGVLIAGETGTGKGEIAKAIHQHSRRREHALVEINCGALPEGIVESELFGHEKGAFTGASTARKGRFELADRGTLFLDEVGDIPLATQVKLLRVIQEAEFERLGGTQTRKVDVRLIAATHRDLDGMVAQGEYRADLYYRLRVVTIEVPPLRDCLEDIPILVDEFIREFADENSKKVKGISPAAVDLLVEYEWPGNVRELKNCIEGMVVMCPREGTLDMGDIPPYIRRADIGPRAMSFNVGMSMEELERIALEETLRSVDFDCKKAAEILKIGLSTLYRKLKAFDIR